MVQTFMISLSTDLTQNIHALVVQPQIFPTDHGQIQPVLRQHCNPLLPAKLQGQNHILAQFIEAVSDKKHFEIEVHFIKSLVPISQDANISHMLQFLSWFISPSQCANHKLYKLYFISEYFLIFIIKVNKKYMFC